MIIIDYARAAAAEYARKWAYGRNPAYYNFDGIGGDCTNFISQCLFAACKKMNRTPVTGWYYDSPDSRAPAWTSVEYLYAFLTKNGGYGPFGALTDFSRAQLGDIIQLGRNDGSFYHSLIITDLSDGIKVCAHSFNAKDKPLNNYIFARARVIHIIGARV